jgi:L-ascorbate metabolism protein UlaG (beta-lactamase superfamily)
MKITKLEHACLVIEIDGKKLVIDPGSFTIPLADVIDVVAVVITHEHADHWTPEHLEHILKQNPEVTIFGPAGVVAAASDFDIVPVNDGDTAVVEPFSLAFYGEKHAVIHPSIPIIDNVGVLVNDTLYYPGDSFTIPPVSVDTLAAPAGAPWLKISEAMDFVTAVAPKRAFPTHQMVLSVIGQGLANERLDAVTAAAGGTYTALEPGESLTL